MSDRVVIIGAGHNGLTAAAFLARAGREVVVVEARPVIGGLAAREEFCDGFASTGLLHHTSRVRRRLLEPLELGKHGLVFRDPPPLWAPTRGDGEGLWIRPDRIDGDLPRDSGDQARYAAHRAFVARVARVLVPVMEAPPPDPRGKLWPLLLLGLGIRRLGARDMTELLRVAPMSAADWLRDSFDDERLRAALAMTGLEGSFAGPWSPHGATSVLLAACLGGAEVAGGPAALTDALARAARSHGATIRTEARVAAIRLSRDASAVTGVALADDEEIAASVVASSCDPRTTFLGLVGARYLPAGLAADMARIRCRGVTAKMHLAVSGTLESKDGRAVEALQTGETLAEIERAFDAVKYGEPSPRPVLDVRVLSGDGVCPDRHQVVSVLAYFAPHSPAKGWSDEARAALGKSILAVLGDHVPDLAGRIIGQEILTPADIEARHGVAGGHLHHGEVAPDQLLFMRPTLGCARYATPIRGLYLAGSGSHPGGGITCAPGALAAQAILSA